jgi:cytochrome c biogenesis protein CcmG, thiol:disulfide interchange protein DsbE
MSNEQLPPELDARPQSRREWSGWLRSIVLPLGLVVAIIGGLLYLQSNRSSTADDGYGTVQLPSTLNTTGQAPAASIGRAAPDFVLRSLDGAPVRLSDLQGRPVIVNFWATWCGPCRVETPDLITTYESHRAQDLVVLGVNLRENEGRVRGFADEFGIPYPILFDNRGEVASSWSIGGPMQGLPASYFIDSGGVVRKVVLGAVTERLMGEGLALILPEGS